MFTGIIKTLLKVSAIEITSSHMKLAIETNSYATEGLQIGASIAVDGVCLTVVAIDSLGIWFDVVPETLQKTTLGHLKIGDLVHIERAAKFGDEIGGHLLSGHVYGTAEVVSITKEENCGTLLCRVPMEWTKYLLLKGYVAVDGTSLTIASVNPSEGTFGIALIPETIRQTKFGTRVKGNLVNIEIDSQTQAIVDTLNRHQ